MVYQATSVYAVVIVDGRQSATSKLLYNYDLFIKFVSLKLCSVLKIRSFK
jgi:hypothetical protein